MTHQPFVSRHIGPRTADQRAMLAVLGVPSLETLIAQAVPQSIRIDRPLDLPAPASEAEALAELSAAMAKNVVMKSFIGAGYHGVHVPPVIQRNLFENPAWYTAYTPYQAEISQGRLELLFHFQTLVTELTGLPVASASLLDEATAVAEAVGIAVRHHRDKRHDITVAGALHPHVLDVVMTRAEPLGITIGCEPIGEKTAAVIIPWPDTEGVYRDHAATISAAKAAGAVVIFVADPLALTLTDSPASLGADIAVGSMQRYGVPMGFGGPHAAYCAVSEALTRLMPGRLVGQSVDAHGRPGYRLALQTREQHIRRDKATSNICTAQALLANMAASYAIWHGPDGLQAITTRVHGLAARFAAALAGAGIATAGDRYFDTVTASVPGPGQVDRRCGRSRRPAAPRPRRKPRRDRLRRGHDRGRPRRACRAVRRGRADCGRHDDPRHTAREKFPNSAGVPREPLRDGHDAFPAPPRRQGSGARPRHDPARLVHDETQRRRRDDARLLADCCRPASFRAGSARRWLPRHDRRPRALAFRDHRLRRRVAAAQCRQPGRICRPARHPPPGTRHAATATATSA